MNPTNNERQYESHHMDLSQRENFIAKNCFLWSFQGLVMSYLEPSARAGNT